MKTTCISTCIRKCYILLILSSLLHLNALGSTCNKGLIFNGSNRNSALILTGKDFARLDAGFKIEFYFFLYPESEYGTLFKVLENKHSLLDFSYYPLPSKNGRLTLRLEATGQLLTFDLDPQDLTRNAWQHLEMSYIPTTKTLLLTLNKKSKVIQGVENFITQKGSFHIGPDDQTTTSPTASICFAIKNVSVFSHDGRLKHFYSLEKNKQNAIIDLTGNQHLNINNPRWIEDLHNHWSVGYKTSATPITSGVFSAINLEFYLFTGEVLSVVNADQFRQKIIPVIQRLKSESFHLILNQKQDALYCFNSTWDELVLFDLCDFTQHYYKLKNGLPPGDQSIGFYHIESKTPMVLIGSKAHAFTGHFYRLDLKQQIWKINPLKEELSIDSVFTHHLSPNHKLLHILCSNTKHSRSKCHLLEVNLTSLTHKTLATYQSSSIGNTDQLLSQNFISPANNQEFYLFQQEEDSCFILELDAALATIKRIPVSFPDLKMKAPFLAFNPHTDEIVCIAQEMASQQTGIYTLNFPPASIGFTLENDSRSWLEKSIIGLLTMLVAWILYLIILAQNRKKKLREILNHPQDHYSKRQKEEEIIHLPQTEALSTIAHPLISSQSIDLLGTYRIYNQNSEEVNGAFTSFLEEFFLFLLVSSIFKTGKGITSEEINQAFWPYHDASSARNNRGVNISRLRKILGEIEGITLIFDKNQYQLVLSDSFDIDLQTFLSMAQLILSKQAITLVELKTINQLIQKGPFLNHLTSSWLDPFREQFELLLSHLLELTISSNTLKTQTEDLLDFCRLVLVHDKLNESALQMILFIHGNQQKKDLQRQVYQSFTRNYLEMMGEAYNVTIIECISAIENQILENQSR